MKKVREGLRNSVRVSLRDSVAFVKQRRPTRAGGASGGSGGKTRAQSRFVGLDGDDLLSEEERLFRGVSMEALEGYVDRLLEGEEAPDVELFEFRENHRVRGELAIYIPQGTTVMFRGTVGLTTARSTIYLPGVGDLAVDADLLAPKPRREWTTSDLLEFVIKGHPDDGICVGAERTKRQGPCIFAPEDLGDPYEGSVVSHMYTTNLLDLVRALAAQFRARGRDPKYARVWLNLFADVGVEGRMLEQGETMPSATVKPKRTLRERLADANARGAAIAAAASKIIGPATTEVGAEEAVDSDDEDSVGATPRRRSLGPRSKMRASKQRLSKRRTHAMHLSVHQALVDAQRRDELEGGDARQSAGQRRRPQLLDRDLLDAFQQFSECLLYMASWEEQIEALHDIEFVCELYTISNLKGRRSNLDIVMPRQEYERYIIFLADDFDGLMQQLFGADQARARAALSVARAEQLHLEIEKLDEGFETLEAAILIWMQDWLLRDLLRNIDAARPRLDSLEDRQMLADLLSVGARMMTEFGTLDRAHDFLEEALETINDAEAVTPEDAEAASKAKAKAAAAAKANARGSTRRLRIAGTGLSADDEVALMATRTIGRQRARIQHEMALVRLDLGRYQEALEDAQSSVLARRELFGKRSIPVARSLLTLGLALGAVDRHGDMLAASMQALEIVRAFEGGGAGVQVLVAEGLRNLAIVHAAENQLDLALSELQQVQTMQLEQLGYLHPALMTTQLQKATILLQLDLPGRALLRCRDAARIARQRQMAQHPCMGRVHALMGRVCAAQNQFAAAVDRFEKALAIMQSSLDGEHPDILETKHWIAEMMRDVRPKDALAAHRVILESRKTRLGKDSLATAESLQAIGAILRRLGDDGAARESIVAALRVRRAWQAEDLPPQSASARKAMLPCVAESALELAFIEEAEGRPDEAVKLFSEHLAFARAEERFQAEATTAIALAGLWVKTDQRLDEAAQLLDAAHYVARKALQATMQEISENAKRKTPNPGVNLTVLQTRKVEQGGLCADALALTGEVHRAKGDFKEALAAVEEAVVIRSKLHGSKSLVVSRLVRQSAIVLRDMGKTKDAATRLEKVYTLQKECDDHEFVVAVLLDLAEIYFDVGDSSKALDRLQVALGVAEAHALSRASILTSLGLQTEDPEQAFAYCEATLRAVREERDAAERVSLRKTRMPRMPDDRSLARVQLRIAAHYLDHALFEEAVSHASSALASFRGLWEKSPAEDLAGLFEASARLGYAHFRLGQLEETINVLAPAVATIQGAHETKVSLKLWAQAVDALGHAYHSLGAFEDALPMLQLAASLRLEQNQPDDAVPFLNDAADAALAAGKSDVLLDTLRELEHIHKEGSQPLELAKTLLRIGRCLVDDFADSEAALEALEESVSAFEEASSTPKEHELQQDEMEQHVEALRFVLHILEELRAEDDDDDSRSDDSTIDDKTREIMGFQRKLLALVIEHPDLCKKVDSAAMQLSYVEHVLANRSSEDWTDALAEEALAFAEAAVTAFEEHGAETGHRKELARAHVSAAQVILWGGKQPFWATNAKRSRAHLESALEILRDLHEHPEETSEEERDKLVALERFSAGRLAALASEDGRWKRVLALLEQAADLGPLDENEARLHAKALVEVGRYEDALATLGPQLREARVAGNRKDLVADFLQLIAACLEQLDRLETDFDSYLYGGGPTVNVDDEDGHRQYPQATENAHGSGGHHDSREVDGSVEAAKPPQPKQASSGKLLGDDDFDLEHEGTFGDGIDGPDGEGDDRLGSGSTQSRSSHVSQKRRAQYSDADVRGLYASDVPSTS